MPVIHQYLDYTRNLKLNREFSKEKIQEIFSKMSNTLSFKYLTMWQHTVAGIWRQNKTLFTIRVATSALLWKSLWRVLF